ncbi:MAG: hypothetical protein COT35_08975 [Nitrospirae bacterium CG08_land_8_20_14_0_20_52_24]|nr:MAG: hypothetical protein COT35_08975 [Nitrospirae bacterium CG08_land_8_20_14_0_20_52_24]
MNDLVRRFLSMKQGREEDREKTDLLTSLIRLFDSLGSKPDFLNSYPEFSPLFFRFRQDLDHGDPEVLEDDLAAIYCYLHGSGSAYSPSDRKEMDACGGYWCHAGGLSPLFRAGPFITEKTRLADYGAGNGFQGLLFQHLYPHKKTCQIELSSRMIQSGRRLQSFMGIPGEKVDWLHKNVMDVPPADFDFIYIYRPVRPEGKGRAFYEGFARELDHVRRPVTIFSIADCLKDFLGRGFRIFHDDGHLTCFTNQG